MAKLELLLYGIYSTACGFFEENHRQAGNPTQATSQKYQLVFGAHLGTTKLPNWKVKGDR